MRTASTRLPMLSPIARILERFLNLVVAFWLLFGLATDARDGIAPGLIALAVYLVAAAAGDFVVRAMHALPPREQGSSGNG